MTFILNPTGNGEVTPPIPDPDPSPGPDQPENPEVPVSSALKHVHIGYTNLITADNITASSQAAGFPAANLVNPLTAHRWKATSLPATVEFSSDQLVSYIGIASHKLATYQCTIEFQYTKNSGSSWTTIATKTPTTNRPIMIVFDPVSFESFRIRITRNGGSTITDIPGLGVFMIGEALVMQRGIYQGHSPITMSRKTKRLTNKTEGGQYAGNSIITEGVSTSFEWSNIEAGWVRAKFDPFIIHARSRPFFIAWRYSEFPNEVGFCWTDDDIRPSNSGPRDLMSISMTVNGYSDE